MTPLSDEWIALLKSGKEMEIPLTALGQLQPPTASIHKARQLSIDAANSIPNIKPWVCGIAYQINEERRRRGEAPSNDMHVLLGSTEWWAQERMAIIACMIDQTPNPPPNIREKGRRIEHHLKWMK